MEDNYQLKGRFKQVDLTRFEKLYDAFDSGHDRDHLEAVRNRAVILARKYCPNKVDLAYIAATLHDIGLSKSRDNHGKIGAEMVLMDEELKEVLTDEELEEIAHCVKEHRASVGSPKTILAKIVSDADKTPVSPQDFIERVCGYGVEHFPEFN